MVFPINYRDDFGHQTHPPKDCQAKQKNKPQTLPTVALAGAIGRTGSNYSSTAIILAEQ